MGIRGAKCPLKSVNDLLNKAVIKSKPDTYSNLSKFAEPRIPGSMWTDAFINLLAQLLAHPHHGFHELTIVLEARQNANKLVPIVEIVIDATVDASKHITQVVIHFFHYLMRDTENLAELLVYKPIVIKCEGKREWGSKAAIALDDIRIVP